MTPREFSELTGMDMKADNFMDEYTMANAAYMAAGDLDKQIFCDNYKKHGITSTVRALTDQVDKLSRYNTKLDKSLDDIKDKMAAMGMVLIDLSESTTDKVTARSLYHKANIMMGRKEAIIYRIRKGYKLSDADREFVIGIIENND